MNCTGVYCRILGLKIILKYTKYAKIVKKIADFINVGPMQN